MTYYRVITPHDVYIPELNDTLIYDELYTQRELNGLNARLSRHNRQLNMKYFEPLDLKRNEIYWFFGCRFMTDEAKERLSHV